MYFVHLYGLHVYCALVDLGSSGSPGVRPKERDCFYYIIEQTYDVGLHSRRHPMEFDACTRPFASFNAPSS